MKSFYKLLGWLFGLSAFSVIVGGILAPMYFKGMIPEEGAFRFFIIFIPALFASILFHTKAKQLDWENDLFYLTLRLILKKFKASIGLIKKRADEAKDKIRDDLNE
tara:strand:- start:18 stop:335 length:318 start_codon:yes stop_codon:yes gene_type:complete